jgi:hypothetical protein
MNNLLSQNRFRKETKETGSQVYQMIAQRPPLFCVSRYYAIFEKIRTDKLMFEKFWNLYCRKTPFRRTRSNFFKDIEAYFPISLARRSFQNGRYPPLVWCPRIFFVSKNTSYFHLTKKYYFRRIGGGCNESKNSKNWSHVLSLISTWLRFRSLSLILILNPDPYPRYQSLTWISIPIPIFILDLDPNSYFWSQS